MTLVRVSGGVLQIEGDFTITTLDNIGDGEIIDNHTKTAGNAVTTANNTSGTLDLTQSGDARTYNTLEHSANATLSADLGVVTINNLNFPTTQKFTLTTEGI